MQDDALPNLGADCGVTDADGNVGPWAYTRGAIEFVNDVAANSADDTYSCLTDGTVLEGTDILTVRRVSGVSTAQVTTVGVNPTLLPNLIYLRSNSTAGALFFSGSAATNSGNAVEPALPPYEFWEYYSRIYFVSPSTLDPGTGASTGDNIPTLYRGFITEQASPTIAFEPLAEGVEDMQIAFGIDTDGDGIVNRYEAAPTAANIANAITARIQLLVRSVVADPSYTNNKIYNIFGKDDDGDGQTDENTVNPPSFDGIPKDDNFYRRIANTTVILRNPALARGITPQ